MNSKRFPALKPLHSDFSLNAAKLASFDRLSTEVLLESLLPSRDKGCLKTRRDGTILDGHHRIYILRRPSVDVDSLPREIIDKDSQTDDANGSPLG